jgi:hypothetical protein
VTFGWEGFSLEHPDEWAPVVLSGNRDQGYARIASPGRLMLQVRWRRLKGQAGADGFLKEYLARLDRDARKSGTVFSSTTNTVDGRLEYRYSGQAHGRGVAFVAADGRTFVLEAVSSKSDATLPILRTAVRSFRAGDDSDRWSAFGLDLALPPGLMVERRNFLAGKTTLDWRGRGVRVHAERWGLANQLLAQHELASWATTLLRAKRGVVRDEGHGIRICIPSPAWTPQNEALVCHQASRNQIVVVVSASRDPRWRPEWGWLN